MRIRPFGAQCEVRTPAKLNLFLELLGRRPDGFHELETLMTTVSIFDSLRMESTPTGEVSVACAWATGCRAAARGAERRGEASPWEELPASEDNLVVRAVRGLRERAGVESGARIWLDKRIPAAAGLGGASSDAAAGLVAANRVWGLGWSASQLQEVAQRFGSDIPFFVDTLWSRGRVGTAVCRGRGELVEPVRRFPRLPVVLVRPPAGLSTAAVYRECRVPTEPRSVEPLLAAAARGDLAGVARSLHNALQASAARLSPWIGRLQEEFRRLDCLGHAMSGSGSTYFGVFRGVGQARRVAQRLQSLDWGVVFWGWTGG